MSLAHVEKFADLDRLHGCCRVLIIDVVIVLGRKRVQEKKEEDEKESDDSPSTRDVDLPRPWTPRQLVSV